jgi:16S rRNA (uracil1498-N3)-methyltransferase
MSLPRFHIPPDSWSPGTLALADDEARHCTHVMRRGVGDEIIAFNGVGGWARCRITTIARHRVDLACETVAATPAPAVSLTLLQAIPKAGNMELIIEKAVELGSNAIVPVFTERTVVKLDAREAAKKREKWQRLALEACKQCGQNWLPHIHDPQPFETVWDRLPAHDLRLIAAIQDDARSFKGIFHSDPVASARPPAAVLMAIGPEGDFTPAEYALARKHGCEPVTLGSIILRVETAALYCLSVLAHELRDAAT